MPPTSCVPRSVGVVAAAVGLATVLAACSSGTTAGSGSGSGGRASSAGSGAVSRSAGPSTGGTAAAGATGLAYRLHRAVAGITSDHLAFTYTVNGQSIMGTADQKLNSGTPVAYTLTESLPQGGSLSLVHVGGQTYAKLPPSINTSGKPWLLVSASSSNATARSMATSLNATSRAQSLQTTGEFVRAAKSVTRVGPQTIDGVRTTRYAVVIDARKLPATFPDKVQIVQSGIGTFPAQLFLDGRDRPVRIQENLQIGSTATSATSTISHINVPVTVTAPPASQVAR